VFPDRCGDPHGSYRYGRQRTGACRPAHLLQHTPRRCSLIFSASTKYLKYSISSCAWRSHCPASHPNGKKCSRETASLVVWPCTRYPQYSYLAARYRAIPGDAPARASCNHPATTFSIDLDPRAATQQARAGRGELTHQHPGLWG
jgi:hypothetical protein